MLFIQNLLEWLGEKISSVLYWLLAKIAQLSFRKIGHLEVTGSELLPTNEPYILVANHLSFNDPPALVASISRRLHFISKKDYTRIAFIDRIIGALLKTVGVYTYDRQSVYKKNTLDQVKKWLTQGRIAVLFPEGTRSRTHQLQKALAGVVFLAIASKVAIIPVGISGTEKFPAWKMLFPFHRSMQVTIGKPFKLPKIVGNPTSESREMMLDIVMSRIADCLPPDYRGVYTEEPN